MNKKNTVQKKTIYCNNKSSNLYNAFIQNSTNLGHNSLKLQKSWHSNLSKCFLGTRNKTMIFNYKFTLNYLIKALYIFAAITKSNGDVLIVNTDPELSKLMYHMKKNTKSHHLFFSDCGWTKGSLTNWNHVFNKVKTFTTFYHDFDRFLNINNIHFPNYKKMKKSYKGFIKKDFNSQLNNENETSNKKNLSLNNMNATQNYWKPFHASKLHSKWKPDVIVLISINNTESIIKEAYSLNVPIIAFLDSNSNISNITYGIPTNIYHYYFIWFFSILMTKLNNKYFNLNCK